MCDGLITYPAQFFIKILGLADTIFESSALYVLRTQIPTICESDIQRKYSANQKYLSITATITATSQVQIDALYTALSQNPNIMMVL